MELQADKPVQHQDDEIDLREYWRIVSRRKWGILGLAVVVSVAAAMVALSITPIYRATATLLIESKQAKVLSMQQVYDVDSTQRDYIQTQFEVVKSRAIAERVVKKLKLDQNPEFNAALIKKEGKSWREMLGLDSAADKKAPETEEEKLIRVVDEFMKSLDVAPVRNTQLVKISFESQTPELARDVANALANEYIDSEMEGRLELTRKAADWLSVRLDGLRVNLANAETRLQAYKDQHQIVELKNDISALSANEMEELTKRAVEAEVKVSELSKRYGPEHPKMQTATNELNSARQAIARTKLDIQETGRKEFKLRELEREVEVNRQMFDAFLARVKETREASQLETANARVVDPAVKPALPEKPKKSLIVALAFVLSVMLGVMLAFLFDFLDNTFKGVQDIEDKLGVPMLGLLPLSGNRKKKKDGEAIRDFLDNTQSSFSEAIRTIRTGVILSGLDNPHKVVLVTSSVPGEGKSTTATNLAAALGQMERVLLIDADMRRPSVAKYLGLPKDKPGLSSLVAGAAKLEDCVHHAGEGWGMDVLLAGIIPPNPLELLSSKRFAEVLHELEGKYDRIVIDSPPAGAVSDPLVLAAHANAVIYVVKSDSTSFHVAKSGIGRLLQARAPIAGAVLNQVDVRKAERYGNYTYGYYDTYGYGSSKKD